MIINHAEIKVIAEIGCNHEGNFAKAVELMHLAIESGANIIKYQSYTPERYVSADNPERLSRVTKFALTKENYYTLAEIARQNSVEFMSTPLTEDWVEWLNPLCSAFKIASGDITFRSVIEKAAKTNKHLIISTGAATIDEISQAVKWVEDIVGSDQLKERLTLMHCVSAYPTPINEANILSIPFLREKYNLNVGYSNHVIGMSACFAAVAQGAQLIEVHFTDQKEGREFRDHSLSFDSLDLKNFIKIANEIRQSLGSYNKEIQPSEKENINIIRKGIIAADDIKEGEILSAEKLMYSRPATEFTSLDLPKIIGKKVNRTILRGHLISKESICAE